MKNSVLYLLIIIVSRLSIARTGGPDVYGYTFRDSESGATFSWIDISGAIRLELESPDDGTTYVSLPFPFKFYGVEYSEIWVSTNGLISFRENSASAWVNYGIPSSSEPNATLAVYWDDLEVSDNPSFESAIYKLEGGVAPQRWIAITWYHVCSFHFDDDHITFQVILYENSDGSDGQIAFQYLDVEFIGGISHSYGLGATVGIENETGFDGLQYGYNDSTLTNQLRIDFIPPIAVDHDILASGILYPSGIVSNATPYNPKIVLRNIGIFNESGVVAGLRISGRHSGETYFEQITVSLDSADIDTFELPHWTFLESDTFDVILSVSLDTDENPTNDSLFSTVTGFSHISHGGPDGAGYVWFDSFDPDTNAPSFIPIDTVGAEILSIAGDERILRVDLPFDFYFYGELLDSVTISTNGFVTGSNISSGHYSNDSLPTTDINGVIAPFWDDLKVDTFASTPSKVFIKSDTLPDGKAYMDIIFYRVYLYSPSSDYLSFCIRLVDNNEIYFSYENLYWALSRDAVEGRSATVGISAPDASTGLMYEFNGNPPGNPVFDGLTVRFIPPVDTFGPIISHYPSDTISFCSDTIELVFRVTDMGGVFAETLYLNIPPFKLVPSTVVDNDYLFRVVVQEGDIIEYWLCAWDNTEFHTQSCTEHFVSLFYRGQHYGGNEVSFYRFEDSYSIYNPPEFIWEELDPALGGDGIPVGSSIVDDTIYGPFPTWFVEFWPVSIPYVIISSNGWISSDTTLHSSYPIHYSIPDSADPNYLLAVLWADLTPLEDSSAMIFYKSDTLNRRFIVEWRNLRKFGASSLRYPTTFQVVLAQTDTCDVIEYRYLTIGSDLSRDVTVGIETDIELGLSEWAIAYVNFGSTYCLPCPGTTVRFTHRDTTYVYEKPSAILRIDNPYPNPFNSSILFSFTLSEQRDIQIYISDILGRKVAVLFDGVKTAGKHSIAWNPQDEPSGIYFVTIESGKERIRRAIALVK